MILTGRNEEALKQLVKDINDNLGNFNVHYILGDSENEAHAKQIVEAAIKHFGRIDIAVLSAGVGLHEVFDEHTDLTNFRKLIDVNLFGPVHLTKYLLPHLKKTNGQIVAITSASGLVPTPQRNAYCASKSAATAFFESLRLDIGEQVSITICCPSTFVGTNFRKNNLGAQDTEGGAKETDKSMTVE